MDDFLRYFEDSRFVEWIYHPSDELNHYWENYIRSHPDEKQQIQLSRSILLKVKSRKSDSDPGEAAALFADMMVKLHKKPGNHLIKSFLRYAAVALIFLCIGILMVYLPGRNQYKKWEIQADVSQNESDARLILSDGKKIILQEKESLVEYSQDGKIVINRQDTIVNQKQSAQGEMNQLIVPYGKNSSIRLPDGTMAYLNAGSRLMYPAAFQGKSREVFLLGEGYFEVTHDKGLPFIVRTNDLSVVVTGTRFNVSAYPADKIIETVLVDGKVVVHENSLKIFRKEVELKPNELASFNRETLETNVKPVDVSNHVAWHEGYLNFRGTDLNRIVARLERYYNIKIFLDDPMLGMRRITGKLALREDTEKVLEVLASTSQAELLRINEATYGLK